MKKNLGNNFVRKSIIMAMAFMLVASTPIMKVNAAESASPVIDATKILDDTTSDDTQADAALKDAISQEQNAFISNIINGVQDNTDTIKNGLGDIVNNQETDPNGKGNAYNVINDAEKLVADNVISEVNEAIDKEVDGANLAADSAVDTVYEAVSETEELSKNLDNYNNKTDELLNKDSDIVASVEGNIENNNIVTNVTDSGEILLDVKDANGDNVNVVDYTEEKAEEATEAAKNAQNSYDRILHSSNVNIAEERAKIDEALATAIAAKDDAESAYNAANAVLIEEIKRYNAYVQKYYPNKELYQYTDANGNTSTPVYTAEEFAKFTSDLTMNEEEISNAKENFTVDLSEQANKIAAVDSVVKGCQDVVDATKNAVTEIKEADNNLVECLDNVKKLAENALNALKDVDTSDSDKAFYQDLYNKASALIDEYKYTADDEFNKPLEQTHPDPTKQDSYHERLDYAADSVSSLAGLVDAKLEEANEALYNKDTGAIARYQAAASKYAELKAQYDAKKNNVDNNFLLLEEKLKEAESEVKAAYTNLNIAINKVNEIQEIKDTLESNGSSDSGSNSEPTDSTTASAAPAAAVLTIDDVLTPLTDTIADEPAPLTEAIMDEQVPLIDSVPKTGDAAAAAGAVGTAGVITMLGALFLNLKKRTLR